MRIASLETKEWRSLAVGAVVVAASLAGSPMPARGQGEHVIHVAAAAGIALPAGGAPAGLQRAFHRQAAIDLLAASWPVGVRVEGNYDTFTNRVQIFPPCAYPGCTQKYYVTSHEDVMALSVDLLVPFAGPSAAVVTCLVGGVGVYGRDFESSDHSGKADAGLNLGVDVSHPRSHLFVGVRGHFVNGGPRYVPIVAGVRF